MKRTLIGMMIFLSALAVVQFGAGIQRLRHGEVLAGVQFFAMAASDVLLAWLDWLLYRQRVRSDEMDRQLEAMRTQCLGDGSKP